MQKRSIGLAIVLSLITCGIYNIYWFVVLTNDVKTVAEDKEFPSGGVAVLLTIITCGIYGVYWAYKMGELVKSAQTKKKIAVSDNSILYLILQLLGLGIVNQALIQNDLNNMI